MNKIYGIGLLDKFKATVYKAYKTRPQPVEGEKA